MSESEGKEYLVRGALLKCVMGAPGGGVVEFGSHKRRANLTNCHGCYTQYAEESEGKKPMLNQGDCKPEVNIMSFGVCYNHFNKNTNPTVTYELEKDGGVTRVTGKECTPKFIGREWEGCKEDTFIDGKPALTMQSYIFCENGGVIIPETSGQEEIDAPEKQAETEAETGQEATEANNMPGAIGETGKPVGLSQTDAAAILVLEKLFSEYELKKDASGTDATIREIQRIQQKNSIPITDYSFASEKKTTRVSIDYVQSFRVEDIHKLHKKDDMMIYLAGLIPGVGPVLGGLSSLAVEQEQNEKISARNVAKNTALGILNVEKPLPGFIVSAEDTRRNLIKDKKDTYNSDGITIQENDTYVQIRTVTNQGLRTATIKAYIRNDEILEYQEFNSNDVTVPRQLSYENMIKSKWKKEGYE
ncbi:protein of unknown function [Anaerovirgula multivorans]|uniref:DUF4280 domain-containing protein n=1 Tax=Anaerovirgula multivorans TaxID=312168 RepID=A0A239C5C7_9FIRM|nr:DUF4280 domain-containing protein [Anaerovirgula multivorans]SNS15406.1 protein of unknown function [Anaerovirgula multivorans]